MPLFQTDFATGKKTMPNAQGDEVIAVRLDFQVANPMIDSTGTPRAALALNDVIEMGPLPAGHVPVDFRLVPADIDTGAGIQLTAGLLNAAKTGMSTDANADGSNLSGTWLSASTAGQAGGSGQAAAATTAPWRVKPLEVNRSLGILVAAAAAGFQAGMVSVVLQYRAAHDKA